MAVIRSAVVKGLFAAVCCAVLAVLAACSSDSLFGLNPTKSFNVGTSLHEFDLSGLSRSYELYVPTKRPMSQNGTTLAYPLLIVLHGSGASGDDMREMTKLDSIGEAMRWVVAFPNGERGAGGLFPSDWDAGTCCGAAGREHIDDVGFIQATIDTIQANLPIDKRRIYVAGFSDGARMAHTLACALAGRITAIAAVSGSMKDDACVPSRTMPVIAIHGDADDIVPYDEDSETLPPKPVSGVSASLPPSMQFWAATNSCTAGTTTQYSPHVKLTSVTKCTSGEIAYYLVAGGSHTWPILSTPPTDDPDTELSASALIVQFLRRQAR